MSSLPKRFQQKVDSFASEKHSDEEWLEMLEQLVMSREPKIRTQVNRYSLLKLYLKEKHNKVVPNFKPNKELVDKVLQSDLETRTNKESFKVTPDIIKAFKSVEGKDNYIDQIIHLMLSSGRRINEIVSPDIQYKKVPKKPMMVRASHLSKQRDNKQSETFELRGMNSTEFKRLLKHVRDATSNDTLVSVNAMVNRRLKKLDKKLVSSHKLRGIYALLLWHESGRKQNLNGFIQNALNQKSSDASLNYSNYILEL